MRYTKRNIKGVQISTLLDYKIRVIGNLSYRRGSGKSFNGKPNCSGYNINKYVHDGMTVRQYQAMIEKNFDPNDPQFDYYFKHLKYDIEHGDIALVK